MISLSKFLITPILELLRKDGLSSDDSDTDEIIMTATLMTMMMMNVIMIQYSPMLSWQRPSVSGSVTYSFCNIYFDTEQRLTPADFAAKFELPIFPELIQRFLYDQLYPESHLTSSDVSLSACPVFSGAISLFASATASFHAPSDPSGIRGIRREQIRAIDSWRHGPA